MLAERNQSSGFSRTFFLVWTGAIAVSVALCALNLFRGEVNQDEGWYLYAARLISQGKMPYVDFACTQGPVLPFVYVLVQPLVDHWGLVAGRLFTAFFGLLCSFAAAWLAARLAPPGNRRFAALAAFCLAGINVYQSYFFTIVKTYALAGLLITMGFVLLSFMHSRRGTAAVFFSGVLIALAAGTRISAGIVLPIVFIWLFVMGVKYSRSVALRGLQFEARQLRYVWLWFGIGAVF